MMSKGIVLLVALILIGSQMRFTQKVYQSTYESINSCPVGSWFEDAKFDIFISKRS